MTDEHHPGRLVRQSVSGILSAGEYRNAIDLSGLAAGARFCLLTTPEGSRNKTFLLVRQLWSLARLFTP